MNVQKHLALVLYWQNRRCRDEFSEAFSCINSADQQIPCIWTTSDKCEGCLYQVERCHDCWGHKEADALAGITQYILIRTMTGKHRHRQTGYSSGLIVKFIYANQELCQVTKDVYKSTKSGWKLTHKQNGVPRSERGVLLAILCVLCVIFTARKQR